MIQSEFQIKYQSWLQTLENYGAQFENIHSVLGEDGVSIHISNSNQPFKIFLPSEVMLDTDRLHFIDDQIEFDISGMPTDLAQMWKEIFTVTLSDVRISKLRQVLFLFSTLPERIKKIISPLSMNLFTDLSDSSPAKIRQLLVKARYLLKNGKHWLIPIIEFCNHASTAAGFKVTEKSISISGTSDDEIFVNYSDGDAFHFLDLYYFPAIVNCAFSLPIKFQYKDKNVQIRRAYLDTIDLKDMISVPKIVLNNSGTIDISAFLLGNQVNPNNVFNRFKTTWESAGFSNADEVFKAIYRVNVRWCLNLLHELEGVEGIAAAWLRQATYQQIQLMAEH